MWKERDMVLYSGVKMYFPSSSYLVDGMRIVADVRKPHCRVFYGDIQSKKNVLCFKCSRGDKPCFPCEMATREELSFFDDKLFQRLPSMGEASAFGGRLQRITLRWKRGWLGSEFSPLRYDIELGMQDHVQDVWFALLPRGCNRGAESSADSTPSVELFLSFVEGPEREGQGEKHDA